MSFLDNIKTLFTPSEPKPQAFPTEEYQGYNITPTPLREGEQFRVCGTITKGEQQHEFFRADVLSSAEDCATETLRKARLTIDQLGDGIFR